MANEREQGGSVRVLIVDDDEDVADVLGRLLRRAGYEIRTAFDARMALQVADAFAPQVAVVDIGLPEVDGYALARALKRLIGAPFLIAMTGYALDGDRAKAKAVGFDEHVTKPFDVAELRAVIARRRDASRRPELIADVGPSPHS